MIGIIAFGSQSDMKIEGTGQVKVDVKISSLVAKVDGDILSISVFMGS